jgi:DNA adenine methylase
MKDNFVPIFLRWAGGKRWLAKSLAPLIKERLSETNTYFEPFLGSGSLFFHLHPSKGLLSDINSDLIITFKQVAQKPDPIAKRLQRIPSNSAKYYEIRKWKPTKSEDIALRFIYLNRNCYGGIYRENRSGDFNVPYGGGSRNHFSICTNGVLKGASSLLKQNSIQLLVCDFEEAINLSSTNDIIYCDPTYSLVDRTTFDRYGKNIFTWDDQVRLARSAQSAFMRGAIVIISNGVSSELENLYKDAQIIELTRPKGLSPNSDSKKQLEALYVLDPRGEKEHWECVRSNKNNKNHQ